MTSGPGKKSPSPDLRATWLAGLSLLLACGSCPQAGETGGYFSVVSENDIYAPRRQDRHYSNGLRLGFGLEDASDRWYTGLAGLSLLGGSGITRRYEAGFGHNIYTPEWFRNPNPLPDDRPYAGWLYGELALTSNIPGMEEGLLLNVGVVGPVAMAEYAQKLNHHLTNDPQPAGWDNQLGNEPALLFHYRRSWFLPVDSSGDIHVDFVPRVGASLGNVFTDLGTGLAARLGNHLPERELPLRIRPGLSGTSSHLEIRPNRFDWMLFGEFQGRAVARNVFLDGNTFTDSLSVDKRRIVWDAAAGLTLGFGQFDNPIYISLSIIWRSREFGLQEGMDNFGSALIGVQFD